MITSRLRAVGALILLASHSPWASASGAYSSANSYPPGQIRPQEFHLGKALFLGKAPLAAEDASSRERQLAALAELQSKLPRREGAEIDLVSLAGRLNEEQFQALLYFLKIRYKLSASSGA